MNKTTLPHSHGDTHGALQILDMLKNEQSFDNTASLFKVMSDPVRVKIFWILCHREECLINLAAMLGMTSPALSHHLRAMHSIIESRREGKEVYYRIADTRRCQLLHKMTEEVMQMSCPSSATNTDIARSVHDYLLDNLEERITIDTLAKSFHINPTTLKAEFKKEYGESIATHINEHRMQEAARLLKKGAHSISDIARSVGFSSQSRFTAAFKAYFGKTPTEYKCID